MQKSPYIWLDGKFVSWDKAVIHVLDYSLHYGACVFEGIKAYLSNDNGLGVFRLGDHLQRLYSSAKALNMKVPYGKENLEEAVTETLIKNKVNYNCYIRPLVWFGAGDLSLFPKDNLVRAMIAIFSWNKSNSDAPKGISVKISSVMKSHPKSFPTNAKISGAYVPQILALMEAVNDGFDDAILFDHRGYVAEGTASNLFLVRNRKIITPGLYSILPGVTRDSIITVSRKLGFDVAERDITKEELLDAEELFLSGTAVEITPVTSINGTKVSSGLAGEVTMQLRKEFFEILLGKRPDYFHWLKFVHC